MKVLIVDDNIEIVEIIRLILEMKNFKVIKAFTGEEGLEVYDKVKPEVVLLDILLPDMSGVEVGKRILEKDKMAKIIGITAFFKNDLRYKCLEAGFIGFVQKPFGYEELLKVINRAKA